MRRLLAPAVAALALCLCAAGAASGQETKAHRATRTKDASRHSKRAADAFNSIMRVRDKAIPKELLEDAEAVAVFPGVLQAAFIVGGRKGQGVISRRTRQGWSAPAFYNLGGGSVGFQAGGSKTDYVLLIMNEDGLKNLLEDKFEIGGEAGVAAGPVGRTLAASTTPTLDAGILSYSRSKGAFVGAALKGVAITPDNDLNRAFYGRDAREVLTSRRAAPTTVRAFPLAVSRYSVRRRAAATKK
jgi:lipid-binding SYLF domain-containing protein